MDRAMFLATVLPRVVKATRSSPPDVWAPAGLALGLDWEAGAAVSAWLAWGRAVSGRWPP